MTTTSSLGIEHVTKHFESASGALLALDDISLDVRAGEFLALLGASGCGKSTLLRLLSGLDTDYEGQVLQDGRRITSTSLSRGIVFQEHRLFPWLNVEKNVALALENAPMTALEKRNAVQEHIELVGLKGFEAAFPRQLSGGMAQRAAIARGLVSRPDVLLLDEPFGALDALTRAHLQSELQKIWEYEGITMVLVTHDVEEAVYLADRVAVFTPRPGRIRAVVDVPLERPRDRVGAAFTAIKGEVVSALGII